MAEPAYKKDGTVFGPLTHDIQHHPAFAALAAIAGLILIVFIYNRIHGGAQSAAQQAASQAGTVANPGSPATVDYNQPPINVYNPITGQPGGGTVVTGTVNPPNPQKALFPTASIKGGNGSFWTDPSGNVWTLVYGGNSPGSTQRIWGVPGKVSLQTAQNTPIAVGQKQLLSGA